MESESLKNTIIEILENTKAVDLNVLDVRRLTSMTDYMIIACGTSNRHIRSIAQSLIEECKKQGHRGIGSEGMGASEWVLVDLGSSIVHIMLPESRKFYDLDSLWADDCETLCV